MLGLESATTKVTLAKPAYINRIRFEGAENLAEHLSEVRRAIPVGDRDAQANATAPINDHVDLTEYRPITPQEKAIVTAMLHSSDPATLAFLPQFKMATAISAKGATRY